MAININASTSAGFEVTPDNSGNLNIQSGGSTKLAITSAGAAVTGTFTVNGAPAGDYNGFKNRIINGDMRLDQRNGGASHTNTSSVSVVMYGTVDRWAYWADVSSKFSAQQSTTAPTGFTNSLLITSLSAYTVGSGSWTTLTQFVEGFNCADLGWGTSAAETITVSFWIRSSVTGTFGASISNGSDNRSYPFTYTVTTANTWEKKTITIAGDTTGTWYKDNQRGLALNFNLATGSTYTGTPNAWGAGWKVNATGTTDILSTNGATLYITGVQLEKGSAATSFDYRDYGNELRMSQRYFLGFPAIANRLVTGFFGSVLSGTEMDYGMPTPVTMRSQPTLAFSNIVVLSSSGADRVVTSTAAYLPVSPWHVTYCYANVASGLTPLYQPAGIRTNQSLAGYLWFSAEL